MDPVRPFHAQILILKLFVEESESHFVFEVAAIFLVTILVVWQSVAYAEICKVGGFGAENVIALSSPGNG